MRVSHQKHEINVNFSQQQMSSMCTVAAFYPALSLQGSEKLGRYFNCNETSVTAANCKEFRVEDWNSRWSCCQLRQKLTGRYIACNDEWVAGVNCVQLLLSASSVRRLYRPLVHGRCSVEFIHAIISSSSSSLSSISILVVAVITVMHPGND